ncbi:MAG: hypothetical protein HDQ88_10585 [Clostridia bacterium]|nr:hypothetical protein [Clostridia bacterium]
MIIEIVGKPGIGKTALNTLFMLRELLHAHLIESRTCRQITELNKFREEGDKLPFPKKTPLYANYKASIPTGYKKSFTPYWVNPYFLGLPTPNINNSEEDRIQYALPGSCLHITEGRKYWDGRESSTMPDNVSQFFETHRHNYLTIIIDAQRGKALDLNVRENVNKFIEVQAMRNDEDAYGRVIASTWYCREFYSLQDYEAYLVGKSAYYREVTYHYEGNIFEFYESRNRQKDFVPPKGKQFSTLEFVEEEEMKKLPKKIVKIYDPSRPDWFRKCA